MTLGPMIVDAFTQNGLDKISQGARDATATFKAVLIALMFGMLLYVLAKSRGMVRGVATFAIVAGLVLWLAEFDGMRTIANAMGALAKAFV